MDIISPLSMDNFAKALICESAFFVIVSVLLANWFDNNENVDVQPEADTEPMAKAGSNSNPNPIPIPTIVCPDPSAVRLSYADPSKPLLILGLTGLLCMYVKEIEHQQLQQKSKSNKNMFRKVMDGIYVYPRPGAFELLKYLIEEYHNVAVWSTLDDVFAKKILCSIIMGKNFRSNQQRAKAVQSINKMFRFIWGRDHCRAQIDPTRPEKKKKYIMRIIDVINSPEVNADNTLTHSNVLMVETNENKIRENPSYSRIVIPHTHQDQQPLDDLLRTIKDKSLFANRKSNVYSVYTALK